MSNTKLLVENAREERAKVRERDFLNIVSALLGKIELKKKQYLKLEKEIQELEDGLEKVQGEDVGIETAIKALYELVGVPDALKSIFSINSFSANSKVGGR